MNATSALKVGSVLAVAALALPACAASDPLTASTRNASGETIVVGSANFPENVILGEVYAQALEQAGFNVERKLNIGAREVLFDQIKNCTLNVVPEYNQALLAFVSPETKAKSTLEVDAALAQVLPDNLEVLKSSPAQDNNAVVVTADTAAKDNLKTLADLARTSPDWVFGGPTEWESRPDGYAGLKNNYGINFKEYKVLDYSGPITISALDKGDIQAGLLFSTTPQIESSGYVVLEDPEDSLGVNNITPLICREPVSDKAQSILEAISSSLTTEELTAMNAAYVLDKEDAADVAKKWLKEQDIK
ncbi:osmoprotectant transport system substrate-binding protein [Arthrobacter bambusae]|uniref:Osmoprotectant transport system substrate-binding protein n=1 Tax=Arthrobacter bambusae TaxID=1338426 RepID=A0ABV2P1D4_9MICC